MPNVENNALLEMARPALILTGMRTGGTFLAHCLSNHPDIFCARGEPLHRGSMWQRFLPHARTTQVLRLLLHMPHYAVSMCKVTEPQIDESVLAFLEREQPRVIVLKRENLLRQAISLTLNRMARAGQIEHPQHSVTPVPPKKISINIAELMSTLMIVCKMNEAIDEKASYFQNTLFLTYAEIVGGEQVYATELACTEKVCTFLEVSSMRLESGLAPVNRWPLSETLSNWEAVIDMIAREGFDSYVED